MQRLRVDVAPHKIGRKIGWLLEAIGHQLDGVVGLRLPLGNQSCRFQEARHSTRVVVGPRLIATHIVVGPHHQAALAIAPSGGNHIRVLLTTRHPLLLG